MWMTRRLVCVLAFVAGATLLTMNRQALADQGCMEWNEELGQMVPCAGPCSNTFPSQDEKSCEANKLTCADDDGFETYCTNSFRPHYSVAVFPKECLTQNNKKCSLPDTECTRATLCEYDLKEKKCKVKSTSVVTSKATKPTGGDCN